MCTLFAILYRFIIICPLLLLTFWYYVSIISSWGLMKKSYGQINGLAIGNFLGPLLADVFMDSTEKRFGQKINKLTLYRWYVDGTLLICYDRTEANTLLTEFNNLYSYRRLISERNSHNSIHRKSTWAGRYLNFYCFNPIGYEWDLVWTLFNGTA